MSDFNLLMEAVKKENKETLIQELKNTGNVLADEQKLLRSERKSMNDILRDIEKLKERIPFDEYVKLMSEYENIENGLQQREKHYIDLYLKKREEEDARPLNQFSLDERKALHKYVLATYKAIDRVSGISYEVIADRRPKEYLSNKVRTAHSDGRRPIIYVPSHIGKNDIQAISEAIGGNYYLLSGDFEHIQGGINAPFLAVLGRYYFNEWIKEQRQSIPQKTIDHLKSGGDLMWFFEGTWNMSENGILLPAYWSIVSVAQEANAIIIPIGVDQYDYRVFNLVPIKTGNHFKINIGQPFDMNLYGKSNEEKTAAVNALTDALATLKYEIWCTEPMKKRKKLDMSSWDKFKEKRYKEWPYFSDEYIADLTFKPKQVLEDGSKIPISKPYDVFEPLKNLDFIGKVPTVAGMKRRLDEKQKVLQMK